MILTEIKTIKKKHKVKEAFNLVDAFCSKAKSLRNFVNYIIRQTFRICNKLSESEELEPWEQSLISDINEAIKEYNDFHRRKNPDKEIKEFGPISKDNSFIADSYFLVWWFKAFDIRNQIPCAVAANNIIHDLCRDWKAFYKGLKAFKKHPESMTGFPHAPGYYDKETGRCWLTLTKDAFRIDENGYLHLPKVFPKLKVKVKHQNVQQIRLITTKTAIKIHVLYKVEEPELKDKNGAAVMGIDVGVNNLAACVFNNEFSPIIFNGRPLKSTNQYYNKQKGKLQSLAKSLNDRNNTNRMDRLTEKRNNKVKDYLHKVSKQAVSIAEEQNVGTIVIGHNKNQKQSSHIGKKNNQNFINIPFLTFMEMIAYKAKLKGIEVVLVDESYTSGTSYLDGEKPEKESYNKNRRKKRGLFISDEGEAINADINAAYQIIKKHDGSLVSKVKHNEPVNIIQVA